MALENLYKNKPGILSVVTCSPDTSIHEVARLMDRHNVGCIVIVEANIPRGIVTDRDILLRVMAKEPALSPADPVRLIMSTPVRTVGIYEGVHDAMKIMKEAKVRRLPVVNSLGCAVGILTFSDLYSLLAHELKDLNTAISSETGFEFEKVA